MFTWLWAIVEFFNNAWAAYKEWLKFREESRQAEAERLRLEREKAAEELKQCKTEKACDDASDHLHSSGG